MKMTKLFSFLLAMILALGVVAIPVSATVPYGSESYMVDESAHAGVPVLSIILIIAALIPFALFVIIVGAVIIVIVVVVKKNKAKNAVVSKEETVSVAEHNSEENK